MKSGVQKTFRKWVWRFLLLFLGLVCTVIFWESVFSIFAAQKKYNSSIILTKKDMQAYTILALGESTTATINGPAWPEYLEILLNKQVGAEKFRVINAGVSGTNTRDVSEKIGTYEATYHPDMVIAMLGINDVSYPALPELSVSPYQKMLRIISQSRVYRFISILWRQISGKSQRDLLAQVARCTDVSLGEYAFQELSASGNNEKERLAYAKQFPFSSHAYVMLIDYYATQHTWKEASDWITRAMTMEPYMRYCAMVASGKDIKRSRELTSLIDHAISYITSMQEVSQRALRSPKTITPSWYQKNRPMLFTLQSVRDIDTTTYYRKIIDLFTRRSIPFVVMQYPLLPVQDIMQRLNNDPRLIYVSNEENFQRALQQYSYDEIFIDHFTGVFGHTTAFGSKLIAEQVAKTVLEVVQKH